MATATLDSRPAAAHSHNSFLSPLSHLSSNNINHNTSSSTANHSRPRSRSRSRSPSRTKNTHEHHEQQHHHLSAFRSRSHSPFSHSASEAAESEYDRLRTLAQSEYDQRHNCADRATAAYHRGDHDAAHDLSERAKEHGRKADALARQASEYIYNELNRPGLVDEDTVDLHGQYVSEAEEILNKRLDQALSEGRRELIVYGAFLSYALTSLSCFLSTLFLNLCSSC